MHGFFTMIMVVDVSKSGINFEQLAGKLSAKGDDMGLKIKIQHEDLFKSMHRI